MMGSQLPRGPPCCSRLSKATSQQTASQPLNLPAHGGRACAPRQRAPRRVAINAFLFNRLSNGNKNGSSEDNSNSSKDNSNSSKNSGANRTRESIASRLSELRTRQDDDNTQALSIQRQESGPNDSSSGYHKPDESSPSSPPMSSGDRAVQHEWEDTGRPSPSARQQQQLMMMSPMSAVDAATVCEAGDIEGDPLTGTPATDGPVTPRSLRYMISDPKPEIKLLHRFKPGQDPAADNTDFWRSFMNKCRLAWGVFFPPTPQPTRHKAISGPLSMSRWVGNFGRNLLTSGPTGGSEGSGEGGEGVLVGGMSAKQVVLNRLQMVLIADRCGVSPEHLLEMKAQTLTALAEYMGNDLENDVAQLEVQVSALKPNGDRITMTIGFADMLGEEQLRDPIQYHYEFEDDDDYFMPEEDIDRIADIAEAPGPGLKAARVAARTVTKSGSSSSSTSRPAAAATSADTTANR